MTERRFVLAIGDALAAEGVAAIAIDLPFHGARTHCVWRGPQCIVNPLDPGGSQICPDPCERNTTCAPDGQCVDSNGEGNHLNDWPIVAFPQASGGAFVDVDAMDATRDHVYQAVSDLSALYRSLREGDWRGAIGYDIDPDVRYSGQSLGGVLGALFVALHPEVSKAVLNVPGADLIDLFRESTVFGPHLDAFLAREGITPGSAAHEQVLNVGPLAHGRGRSPELRPLPGPGGLRRRRPPSSAPSSSRWPPWTWSSPTTPPSCWSASPASPGKDYLAEHAFLVIPVEPAYLRGTRELARCLASGELP
jgi:hypothetical protein